MKHLSWLTLLVLATLKCLSQNCSSGQGDPIVNITFGAGVGIGPPLAPGVTNMEYVTQECVGDNVYTITNQVGGCYVGDWLTVTKDHTGDPNGYFMLIGASFEPSTFYVQTVTGLCGSTQYQFGVWVLNMASHAGESLPNFTFSIQTTSGTLIQSFGTGDVPWHNPGQWEQFTFQFTTPPGVNSVVLQMTNNAPGGYGNDLCLDDITFRTLGPAVNVSVDGHSSDTVTLCNNNGLNFSSVVANSCYASTNYQWQESIDNGANWTALAGASGSTYSTSFATAGSYLYRLTAAAAGNIGNVACQVVSTADTIMVLDYKNSSVTIAASDNSICAGKPVMFTATPTDAGATPTYQWMINGSPALVGQTMAALFNDVPADGDQVNCIMSSSAACLVDPTTPSNTVTMAVTPTVTASVAITASADPVCGGKSVIFTANPSNGGTNPAYKWLVNNTPTGVTDATYTNGNPTGGDEVSCVMTSNVTCPVSTEATSNNIAINDVVVPSVMISANANPVCSNIAVAFATASANGGPNVQYQWLVNNTPAASGDAFIDNTPQNGDQITCVMTSDALCTTDPTATSNTILLNVIPSASLSLSITASADAICSGTLVSFTADPSGDDHSPKYQWLINGVNVGDSSDSYITQGLHDGDLVTAVMTDNQECSNPATSNSIAMTVYPTPKVYLSPDTVIASHTTIQLLPQVSGGGLSYQWSSNITPGANDLPDPYITPVSTSTYSLTVTSGNGCTASAKEVVEVFFDLIMPNAFTPNQDGKNDVFRVPPSNPTSIQSFVVYNRWGAVVFRRNGSGGWDGTSNGKIQPAGTYVWDIEYFDPIIKRDLRKQGTVELIR